MDLLGMPYQINKWASRGRGRTSAPVARPSWESAQDGRAFAV